ncbi:hypothetical protein SAMN05216308_106106 [Nitrosospira sp. Nsp13]|nr:hypothetical protein SAMN05216308_106106 [Nitrosospira sp. Nsp13]
MYRPAFNAEFMQPAAEASSAFMPRIGSGLDDILCEEFERTVGNDNCVRFENLVLQIPPDRPHCHYVKGEGASPSLSGWTAGSLSRTTETRRL